MIEATFIQIAEKAILEKGTNKLSLINMIDAFTTVGFPALIPHLAVVVKTKRDISGDPAETECTIEIRQGDKQLFLHEFKVNYEDKASNNLVVTLVGLVIPGPQPVVFIFSREGKEIKRMEVEVQHISPEVKEAKQASV